MRILKELLGRLRSSAESPGQRWISAEEATCRLRISSRATLRKNVVKETFAFSPKKTGFV
jgi:hypothetical protein